MDMLKSWGMRGTGQQMAQPTGAETVERVCVRARTSTLLTDRRDALRTLKALSKNYRLEVGTQAMEILTTTLSEDAEDPEMASFALETLANLVSTEPLNDAEAQSNTTESLSLRFSDAFLSDAPANVGALLALIDQPEFKIRWPAVKLLTSLLHARGKSVQETVLVTPQGVSKLMDILADTREVVRNDALLLLIELTKGHTSIQKIAAFENAFEVLFGIISTEGASEGLIVVEDCLRCLHNLLDSNKSNQMLFTEGKFVLRITEFFQFEDGEGGSTGEGSQASAGGWSTQKVSNTDWMLRIVRTLVHPSGPQKELAACQQLMATAGLLPLLCSALMTHGIPAHVLSSNISAVAEMIRGNTANQSYFATVMAPSVPPRSAIVVLLMSMVNEKQPFPLRCAVLYCFQCFLYKNDIGQSQVVATFLPDSAAAAAAASGQPELSAAQYLCTGLFSADPLSSWLASVALVHIVLAKADNKESLLKVQLQVTADRPELLFQLCMNTLAQPACKLQTKMGLLMLLSTWMCRCPAAVAVFLAQKSNSLYLVSQVGSHESDVQERCVQGLCAFLLGICVLYNPNDVPEFDQASLKAIIEKRIGLETFTARLSSVTQSESYAMAAKVPYIAASSSEEVLFDHEFTKLFKSLEMEIMKKVEENEGAAGTESNVHQHDAIVTQYKDIIRGQDEELRSVKETNKTLVARISALEQVEGQLAAQQEQNQTLRDQIALYKAGASSGSPVPPEAINGTGSPSPPPVIGDVAAADALEKEREKSESLQREVSELEAKWKEADMARRTLEDRLAQQAGQQKAVEDSFGTAAASVSAASTAEGVGSSSETEERHRAEMEELKRRLATAFEDTSKVASMAEIIASYEKTERRLKEEIEELKSRVEEAERGKEEAQMLGRASLLSAEAELATAKKELAEKETESEDLLVLMEDQGETIKKYKRRLKEKGGEVSSDDDDDDDEEEENEDVQ